MRVKTIYCLIVVFTVVICLYAQIAPEDAVKLQKDIKDLLQLHKRSDRDIIVEEMKKIPGITIGEIKNVIAKCAFSTQEPNGAEIFSGVYVPTEQEHGTYRTLIPQNYDDSKPWQVLIAFPDEGSSAEICIQTWKASVKDCFIVSPEKFGKNWENSVSRLPVIYYVLRDVKKRYNLDDNRVYIAGFGKSAEVVWNTVTAMPDCFAAFAAIGGRPPENSEELANISNLPAYFSAGADSNPDILEANRKADKKLTQLKSEHSYSEPMGLNNAFAIEEAKKSFLWMYGKTRKINPETLTICQSSNTTQFSVYWLNMDVLDPKAVVTAGVKNNTVDITATGVKQVTLRLNESMMDFSKTFIVKANGKTAYSGKVAEDIKTLSECLFESKDRLKLYTAKVTVQIGK
ncbi:MAG: hypothetical protein HZA48_11840 [Planctomycetes bacterium]|nr:hypothetical protein [Planctomycetota bacterium]